MDVSVRDEIQKVFRVLSRDITCATQLQSKLVPSLLYILDNPKNCSKLLENGHARCEENQAVVLETLETLVLSERGRKISPILMQSAFIVAVKCILCSDDSAILQSGGECIRSYVSVSPDQVCAFIDFAGESKSGLQFVVQVASHLLSPLHDEQTSMFVDRLVTTLIRKLSDRLGDDNLELLLKSTLSKLQSSESSGVSQSLIMIYAQLTHVQLPAILNFLCSVPGPQGDSALSFVLSQWVALQSAFFGDFVVNVTISALAKWLHYGVTTNDPRIGNIQVTGTGDIHPKDRSSRRLRSAAHPKISVLRKIFRILVLELISMIEVSSSSESSTEDDASDEAGESKQSNQIKKFSTSTLWEDLENDEDEVSDPMYGIDLQVYLIEFLVEFSHQPYFPMFANDLTSLERRLLSSTSALFCSHN